MARQSQCTRGMNAADTKESKTNGKHTPGPCRRKNRGGVCRSPVYAVNAAGEPTCFYHAKPSEIADVKARKAARALLARVDGGES